MEERLWLLYHMKKSTKRGHLPESPAVHVVHVVRLLAEPPVNKSIYWSGAMFAVIENLRCFLLIVFINYNNSNHYAW